MASGNSSVVELLINDPEFEGLDLATVGTSGENCERVIQSIFLIKRQILLIVNLDCSTFSTSKLSRFIVVTLFVAFFQK